MKSFFKLILNVFFLSILLGCSSPERINISNLSERYLNYELNGSPFMVEGELISGILYSEQLNILKTGFLEMELEVKKGIPNGFIRKYHENGELKEKGTYKNGKLNGPYEIFSEDGYLEEKGIMKDGDKVSHETYSYIENGQLGMKTIYKDGEPDISEEFDENGVYKSKIIHLDGDINGRFERYDIEGNLKSKYSEGLLYHYFDNGNVSSIWTVEGGILRGPYEMYYETGQLKEKGIEKENWMENSYERYDENGKLTKRVVNGVTLLDDEQ